MNGLKIRLGTNTGERLNQRKDDIMSLSDDEIDKFWDVKMNREEALKFLESLGEQHPYKNYKEAEMAFKLGAIWAKNNPEQWRGATR